MIFNIMTTALVTTAISADNNHCMDILDINQCFDANAQYGCRWFRTGTGENPEEGFCQKDIRGDWPECPAYEDIDECTANELCAWEPETDSQFSCTFNRDTEEKLCGLSLDEENCYENPGSCFWTKDSVCDCVSCKGERNFCELTVFVKDSFPFPAMMNCMLSQCEVDPVKTDLCLRSFPETPQEATDACDRKRCECIGGFYDEDGFCLASPTSEELHPCTSCEECSDLQKLQCNADRAVCFHEATHLQVSPVHCADVFQCMSVIPDLSSACKSHREVSSCSADLQNAVCPSHEVLFLALSKSLNSL
eukprot:TRINITY_DN3953_c0_g1_i4.p1 TRINITY_DN3953_c0_g1~~TRINITY_DN3953_c0_g1_i4.p1  ORF type:complete len:307 (+),score=63.54 TRINITY_DN3953_c0_g1_i4:67-987(+)